MSRPTCLITGASSGLGWELALEMASRGYHLALLARREDKLQALAERIHRDYDGLQVEVRAVDVTDIDKAVSTIAELDECLDGIDVGVVNAGMGIGGKVGAGHLKQHLATVDVNLRGAMACCDALMTAFRARAEGHLVGVSSVAGQRGLPRNAAYCASKAAFTSYLESIRLENRSKRIDVTTLKPGYIDTPINEDAAFRPFLIDSRKGAKLMAHHIEKRSQSAYVPAWPWALIGRVLPILPRAIAVRFQ